MGVLFGFAALALVTVGIFTFMRASPAAIAQGLRLAGPVVLGITGGVLMLAGKAGLGTMLLSSAVALWGRTRRGGRLFGGRSHKGGQTSVVHTEWLDMMLDHDSGEMNGKVLKGEFTGRMLGDLSRSELDDIRIDTALDGRSRQLLEAYLESRFPGWRDDLNSDESAGQRAAGRPGGMTHQEAYELLGLRDGATPAEIREAHRRLLKRLHPDKGGSALLAARINEARDILLPKHTHNSPE